MTRICHLAALVALLACATARAENWPNWRGPNSNGIAEGKNYPLSWSAAKNIAWKVKLPGVGSSTPAVWGNQIFVTCGDAGKNALLCFDRDGKLLWSTKINPERAGKNKKASGSNPSPVTDGKHVYVYYKSGDLACVDFQGQVAWAKNLQDEYGKDTLWWDLGTSPVLTREHVIIACMHSGPSYIAAFDKTTGDVAWKHDRNLNAPVEAAQSYTTPVVFGKGAHQKILVLGADYMTAHDAASGKEIWRVGSLNPTNHKYFRSISSPAFTRDMVYAPYARGGSMTAIRIGGKGDVTKSHVTWTKSVAADVPTPIAAGGKLYVCRDRGELVCLDQKTGEQLWSHKAPKFRQAYSSSPVLAGDRIYLTREDGTTFVVQIGDKPKTLAENKLKELTVASPVFVDGQILIRTDQSLFCIGAAGNGF